MDGSGPTVNVAPDRRLPEPSTFLISSDPKLFVKVASMSFADFGTPSASSRSAHVDGLVVLTVFVDESPK